MSYPAEKYSLKTRLIVYTLLLLLALGFYYFVEGAGFWRGFGWGLLVVAIPGELILYLRRRKAKQNQASKV